MAKYTYDPKNVNPDSPPLRDDGRITRAAGLESYCLHNKLKYFPEKLEPLEALKEQNIDRYLNVYEHMIFSLRDRYLWVRGSMIEPEVIDNMTYEERSNCVNIGDILEMPNSDPGLIGEISKRILFLLDHPDKSRVTRPRNSIGYEGLKNRYSILTDISSRITSHVIALGNLSDSLGVLEKSKYVGEGDETSPEEEIAFREEILRKRIAIDETEDKGRKSKRVKNKRAKNSLSDYVNPIPDTFLFNDFSENPTTDDSDSSDDSTIDDSSAYNT